MSGLYELKISPLTILHPLRGLNDPHSFVKTLKEIMPKYVVLYDTEMDIVRQLEVCSLLVYFL